MLDLSTATLYRWIAADKKAGAPWPEPGSEEHFDSSRLIHLVEQRLIRIATDDEAAHVSWCDGILKALQSLRQVYELYGDVQLKLNAIAEFAGWAVENLEGDALAAVRRAVSEYLDHLKRSNAA